MAKGNALRTQQEGQADGAGHVTIKFPRVPQGRVWSVGATVATADLGATWTATVFEVSGLVLGSWMGRGTGGPWQLPGGETLVLTGTGLTASSQQTALLSGEDDDAADRPFLPPPPAISSVSASQIVAGTITGQTIIVGPGGSIQSSDFDGATTGWALDDPGGSGRLRTFGSSSVVQSAMLRSGPTTDDHVEIANDGSQHPYVKFVTAGGTVYGKIATNAGSLEINAPDAGNPNGITFVGAQLIIASGSGSPITVQAPSSHIAFFNPVTVASEGDFTPSGSEYLQTAGANSGLSMRQRSRGVGDATNRAVVYANNDAMLLWQNADLMSLKQSAGVTECRFPATLPALAGNTAVYVTSSQQLGFASSSLRFKEDVADADLDGGRNPVWRYRVAEFSLSADIVRRSGRHYARRHVGLVAEDVAALCPIASHPDAEGRPTGINDPVVQGQLVAAVQELRRLVADLERRVG